MRLYRLPDAGGIDGLRPQAAPDPKPARNQVLVRMRAASLNYRDLNVIRGRYGRGGVAPGTIPLSDGAGEVVEVGPDVTRFGPGDRVAGTFFQAWIAGAIREEYHQSAMGGAIDGVLGDYRVFEQDGLVPLPAHLSFEEAGESHLEIP